jgi:hypothetical protein
MQVLKTLAQIALIDQVLLILDYCRFNTFHNKMGYVHFVLDYSKFNLFSDDGMDTLFCSSDSDILYRRNSIYIKFCMHN